MNDHPGLAEAKPAKLKTANWWEYFNRLLSASGPASLWHGTEQFERGKKKKKKKNGPQMLSGVTWPDSSSIVYTVNGTERRDSVISVRDRGWDALYVRDKPKVQHRTAQSQIKQTSSNCTLIQTPTVHLESPVILTCMFLRKLEYMVKTHVNTVSTCLIKLMQPNMKYLYILWDK